MQPLPAGGLLGFLRLNAVQDKEVDMDRNGDESENAAGGKGNDDKRFGQ